MMQKEQLLQEIKQSIASGQISKEEVFGAFGTQSAEILEKHFKLSDVLYYIGGAIVFLGIIVLIFQNWDKLNTFAKILVTLGSGAACYAAAALFFKYEQFKKVSQVFFLLSGLVLPVGLYVVLDKMGLDISTAGTQSLIYGLLLVVFLASFYLFRFAIVNLLSMAFATGLFYFLVMLVVGNSYPNMDKVYQYFVLVVGLSYMFLGHYLSSTSQKSLSGVLYGFGSLGFLGASLALQGFSPNQNAFWELIFPVLVFCILFASVYVKSKALLIFGSLALIGYILKLTEEYFKEGLGWPLALVLAGFLIMGVGYYAVKLNKKYLVN
jgi:hypothetical protein